MTKKKKSILSDQRFIVLLVIIVLCAIFSGLSKEFRQYTTILSMLDFSYYDLLSDDFRIFVSDNNTNHIRKIIHFKSKKYRFVILHNFSNDICALLMRLIFR